MSRKIELGINSAKIGRNKSEENSGEFNLPKYPEDPKLTN